jgi:hypothetical protein
MGKPEIDEDQFDEDRIDDAMLALMFLTLHRADSLSGLSRAWKSFDWEAMNRLYEKDLIYDPVNKAKSVVLTEEGRRRCEALFKDMFAKRPSRSS